MATIADCYQWPKGRNGGCWGHAGVAAACAIAKDLNLDHAISFDMGGTTTDVCLIVEGRAEISSDRSLAGRPMRMPMVAVESIGAGGGSISACVTGVYRVSVTGAVQSRLSTARSVVKCRYLPTSCR